MDIEIVAAAAAGKDSSKDVGACAVSLVARQDGKTWRRSTSLFLGNVTYNLASICAARLAMSMISEDLLGDRSVNVRLSLNYNYCERLLMRADGKYVVSAHANADAISDLRLAAALLPSLSVVVNKEAAGMAECVAAAKEALRGTAVDTGTIAE